MLRTYSSMKIWQYIICSAIATAALPLELSCTSATTRTDNTFIIATYDDVKDWDPATAFSLEVLPMSNIYEPLLWYDAGGEKPVFVPGLATSYTKSEDGLTWSFTLRENVHFHDGQKFDANAVKFVVERNKTLNRGASYIWSAVDSVRVNGSHQATFELKEPVPLDKIVSSQYGAWMYSPGIAHVSTDSMRNGFGAGTGPYQLKKWIRNSHITLDKFDNYWGGWGNKNNFNSVQIQVVSESSTRLQMVESGLADYAVLIPIQLLDLLEQNPDVSVSYHPAWINHFYLLNTKKSPTDNIWVRRAIAASLDRSTLSEYVYRGIAKEPEGLLPSNIPLFDAPDSLVQFNLSKASNYLKKSGIDPNHNRLDISYVSTSEEYRLTALMLLDNLRKIGLELTLKPGLWSTNWDKAKYLDTAPNIISMAWWPTVSSPADWFFGLYRSQDVPLFNLSYYSNTAVDSLLESAWYQESRFPDVAKKAYKSIQEILIDDCVVIPAADLSVQSIHRSNITGFRNNPAYSTLLVYNLERRE